MTVDVDVFDDEQKRTLACLVTDFDGPSMTATLLYILESVLGDLNPDWERDPQALRPETRKNVEVCMAALQYLRIQDIAQNPPSSKHLATASEQEHRTN
jgi:hypothetical protein